MKSHNLANGHRLAVSNQSYLKNRLAENGITEAETKFLLPSYFVSNYFSSDEYGNINLYYSGLDGEPLTAKKNYSEDAKFSYDRDYVKRTRYANPLPNAPKYLSQKGMSAKLPYLNGLISYFKRWTDIETLVISEGEFKALRACKAGIATIGIPGIGNFATSRDLQYRTRDDCKRQRIEFKPVTASLSNLWNDLLKELPNLKNILFLHDADALEGSEERKNSFFSSIKTFELALRNKPYSLFYGHGITDDFKGIDDLLNSKGVSDAQVRESLLSLKDSPFFKLFPINDGADKQRILKHFFPNYRRPIQCDELTVNVYQYLSECREVVSNVFSIYKRVLLDAPTGTGKTRFLFEYARATGKRMIFAVPYRSQVDQIAKEYKVYSLKGGDQTPEIESAKYQPIVVCTFDKVAEIIEGFDYKNDLLVVDEAHNLVNQDFRKSSACDPVFQAAMGFYNCVLISGTPNPFFECLPNGFSRLRVNRALSKNVEVKPVYLETRKERLQYVLDQLTENREEPLQAVKLNNRDQLDAMEAMLLKNGFEAHQIAKIYNRDELEKDANYLSIINKGALSPEVKILLSTSKINDGINIKNEIKHIYLIDEKCPDSIIQFIGRFRKAEKLAVHFLCKEKTSGSGQNYEDIFGGWVGFSKAAQEEFIAMKKKENIAFNTGIDLSANIDRPHGKTISPDGSIDWLGLLIEVKRDRDEGLTTSQLLNAVGQYGLSILEPVSLEREPSQELTDLMTVQKEGRGEATVKVIEALRESPKELIGAIMQRTKSNRLRKDCSTYLGSSLVTIPAKRFEEDNREFLIQWERVVHRIAREFLTLSKYFPDGNPVTFADFLESMNSAKLIAQIENAFLLHKYQANRNELTPAQRKDAQLMLDDMEEVQAMEGATLQQVTKRLNGKRRQSTLRRNGRQYRERLSGLFMEVETSKNAQKETVISCKNPVDFEAFFNIFSHTRNCIKEKSKTLHNSLT